MRIKIRLEVFSIDGYFSNMLGTKQWNRKAVNKSTGVKIFPKEKNLLAK